MDDFNRDQLSKQLLKDFEKRSEIDLDSEPGIPVKVLFSLILLAVVIFGVYAWKTDKFAISSNDGQPPLVKAIKEPVRVRPDDPGGMYIANRDKKVYDTISQNYSEEESEDLPDVIQILPTHEEPVSRDVIKEGMASEPSDNDSTGSFGDNLLVDIEPSKSVNKSEVEKIDDKEAVAKEELTSTKMKVAEGAGVEKIDSLKAVAKEELASTKMKVAEGAGVEKFDGKEVVAKEELTSTEIKVAEGSDVDSKPAPKVKNNQEPIKVSDIKDTTASGMRSKGVVVPEKSSSGVNIQLGSFRTKNDVEKTWTVVSKKYASLLNGLNFQAQKADLGDRGIFYRLRVGSLANENEARKLCQKLIEQNQGCFVVKE